MRRTTRFIIALVFLLITASLTNAQGYIAAIGGGEENNSPGAWSEAPYRWIVEHANHGHIVILSYYDETNWLPDYFVQLGAASAINIKINSRDLANNQSIYDAIVSADGVFIKGGDQANYVNTWNNTLTEAAIADVYRAGKVIAGTSAGAHVLSQIIYDARNGSVYPEEALRNPYDSHISYTTGFLGFVANSIFDTHFTARGRIARLLPIVARWDVEHPDEDLLGIGLDEKTALLISPDLNAEVLGQGSITFVHRSTTTKFNISPNKPPVFTNVAYDQLTEGFVYNLSTRQVILASSSAVSKFTPIRPANYVKTTINGSKTSNSNVGNYQVTNLTSDTYALQLGLLGEAPGRGLYGQAIIVTKAFAAVKFIENRIGGLQWALANHPYSTGVMLDIGGKATLDQGGCLLPVAGSNQPATLVYDCRSMIYRDYSHWIASSDSKGPQQSVALTGISVHLIASGWSYQSATGVVQLVDALQTLLSTPRLWVVAGGEFYDAAH